MQNLEKYPNTADALRAYHKEHYYGSFYQWLHENCEEEKCELKPLPCPFCGDKPKVVQGILTHVVCVNPLCFATIHTESSTKERAIKIWNTRAKI